MSLPVLPPSTITNNGTVIQKVAYYYHLTLFFYCFCTYVIHHGHCNFRTSLPPLLPQEKLANLWIARMKDSSGKFVQSFMEVDNLFTGAYQHKQTSNFCFFTWFGVVSVGCCKIICCWALVFCCRKLAICQFLAILFFSPLYCSWYANRPLSQGWFKPCRVVEADLSHGTSLPCSCSATTPRCIYSMEWNREKTIQLLHLAVCALFSPLFFLL
jgi:hypothetical protein